ncbi:MAG: serine--tRNA ligase [Patescibacteria group bacterium]|nr:MAG: serine--tRNA ligase [Patescibacteria group bacterium]
MLDLNFVRENPELVKKGAAAKGVDVNVDALLEADEKRRKLIGQIEAMRAEQNQAGEKIAKETDKDAKASALEAMKALKERMKEIDVELKAAEEAQNVLLRDIPNLPLPDVRVGKDDTENVVARTVGEPTAFSFEAKEYMALGESLDIIDTERAAKVSGSRFGYLKGDGAMMEFALVQYVLSTLVPKGFSPVVPPVMIKPDVMEKMGYSDKHGDEIYQIQQDPLVLVGTSEQSVGPMHMDETLDVSKPIRYVAFSTCFRREAGSYGKDTKGILRVHQFDKLEMFSFTKPSDSEAEHAFLLACEEELLGGLGLPYQVLDICSGDLGTPAAKKWDLETWIPSQQTYRETHSTSNCTDFQARRLNIGWKNPETQKREYVHTLNGTAFAIGRILISILENCQEADGTVRIPEVLRPWMGGKTHIGK